MDLLFKITKPQYRIINMYLKLLSINTNQSGWKKKSIVLKYQKICGVVRNILHNLFNV